MDCCSTTSNLLSLNQALDSILSQVEPVSQTEQVDLVHAADRISSQAISSPINVPPFANSAMDGYAVRLIDVTESAILPVAGKAFAGQPFHDEWPTGTCLRIMTGAPIPLSAEAVIMQEQAEVLDNGVLFTHMPKAGQNIRLAGEDIHQNAEVLAAGSRLGTAQLPLLASLGISQVMVYRRLKVALFSTGDELQPIGQLLQDGQIYDTNHFTIRLMLQQLGCEIIDLGIIRDNETAIKQAFNSANRQADLVISSGGVSVGEADYTKQILDEIGKISFWKLAIKPGKPFAFGRLSQSLFCGLPGNPVSAALTFYQLVQPLIAKLSGYTQWEKPRQQKIKTTSNLKKIPGRLDFQRGILSTNSQGELEVRTTGHQGSHVFSSFSQANCFIVLERDRGSVAAGEWVTVEPFNSLLKS